MVVISERLSGLEASSQSEADRVIVEIGSGGGGIGIDTRDALCKLNGNQKTLADAVDQSRSDTKDVTSEIKRDLAALHNRVPKLVLGAGSGQQPGLDDLKSKLDILTGPPQRRPDFWTRYR